MAQIDLKLIMDEATKEVLSIASKKLQEIADLNDDMAALLVEEVRRGEGDGRHDEWIEEGVPEVMSRYYRLQQERT